jgi:hypothetical protein
MRVVFFFFTHGFTLGVRRLIAKGIAGGIIASKN